jgi:hypothetical protein
LNDAELSRGKMPIRRACGKLRGKPQEETNMAHGIALAVLALVAQAAGTGKDESGTLESLQTARRLLQNGRYA